MAEDFIDDDEARARLDRNKKGGKKQEEVCAGEGRWWVL
jgi:hypothetical protein